MAGAIIAALLVKVGAIRMTEHEKSLLEVMGIKVSHVAAVPQELDEEDGQWMDIAPPRFPVTHNTEAPAESLSQLPRPPDDLIRFRCSCGKSMKMSRKHAGKIGQCPRCANKIRILDL